jgi:hypothetical protein
VPKPLAKCPAPYPTPRLPGVDLRRDGNAWLLSHVRAHRAVELQLTTEELRDLVTLGAVLLERNANDDE